MDSNTPKNNNEIPWQNLIDSITESITDEVYNNLPALLRDACNQFKDPTDKEVFLLGATGVLSGCFPNYLGHYDGRWVSSHLYVYVIAPYGSGKGSITYAKLLGQAIHKSKIARTKEAMENYRHALKVRKKKGDKPPERPPQGLFYIPANSSKTAMIEALSDNDGYGIIFETEGDTLADTLKQEYASFSDVLRKAFHHETVSFLRRQDKEYKEIDKPHLGLVLTSTYDQILTLIPNVENGLLSRFLFYNLQPNREFRNVFAKDKEDYESYFESLGENIESKYNYWEGLDKPIYFHLTNEQQQFFLHHFRQEKRQADDNFIGTINRLGLICFRLAMVFAILRIYEHTNPPFDRVICRNIDFENALRIVKALQKNAIQVYQFIAGKENSNDNKKDKKLPEDLVKFYAALPIEFITADGLLIAKEHGIGERRAERFFRDYFKNVSHGKYAKIKSEAEAELSELSV